MVVALFEKSAFHFPCTVSNSSKCRWISIFPAESFIHSGFIFLLSKNLRTYFPILPIPFIPNLTIKDTYLFTITVLLQLLSLSKG